MMEQLNVLASYSTQFLEFVGKKFAEIERQQDETEIWELCRVDRDKLMPKREHIGSRSSKDADKNNYTAVPDGLDEPDAKACQSLDNKSE